MAQFDIARRHDGMWAVYAYMMWPDDYLDADDGLERHRYMSATDGWCARGWITVHVAASEQAANHFVRMYS
jgi:hypothetical protein